MIQKQVKSLGDTPYCISLQADDYIASGSYGKVVRAYSKENPQEKLAAKIFHIESLKQHESAIQELKIVSKLPVCEYLVNYRKIKLTSKNYIYLIMEYCEQGSLANYITQHQYIDQTEIFRFLSQFMQGYKVLIEAKIVHRDIKTDNILIHQNKYKIADFGLSKILEQKRKQNSISIKGSPLFMAPELYHNRNKDHPKIDVYSLGVCLYQMAFKKYPYVGNLSAYKTFKQLIRDIEQNQLIIPSGRSRKFNRLIASMLKKAPEERVDWAELFNTNLDYDIQQNTARLYCIPLLEYDLNIVKTSNTSVKDIELVDFELMQSLKRDSIVTITQLEKSIIHKRLVILFCDRLVNRLAKYSQEYSQLLTNFNVHMIMQIEKEITSIQLNPTDYSVFIESRNYKWLRKVIDEDKKSFQQMLEKKCKLQNYYQCKTRLYKKTTELMELLLKQDDRKLAVYVVQIEGFLTNDCNSILTRCLKQPDIIESFYNNVDMDSHQYTKYLNNYAWLVNQKQ